MGEHAVGDGSIAIIGMGCRLPGDVHAPDELWRLLLAGVDAVGERPAEREPTGDGPAGWLRDVAGFDAAYFGVSGREADVLDPQHRLLLEVTWEALDHAGIPAATLAGSATGVFTGVSYDEYMHRLSGHPEGLAGSVLTNGHAVAPGRVSYLLGLRGPSIALDTACSSSLVALHLACQLLRTGEIDLGLAGGVTLLLDDRTSATFRRMGMLSPTGRCHAFDAAADGFVRGEGCGVVVLKRLDDAVRDGDRVLAVVRGSAVNQDGHSDGLAAPSADAQHELLLRALAVSGVDAEAIGLVEAHGTGTPVGDPVELDALTRVHGSGPGRVALGSVKTNLGHLEPAAGISGLIKAVLCLRAGVVPANLHFGPDSPAPGGRLFVPTETTAWPVEGSRLATVSSFGYSGTNAHVVLEQAPDRAEVPAPRTAAAPEVLLVPAGSARVLPEAAGRLADWLESTDVPLRDVLHTAAVRRSPGRGRLAVVGATREELVAGLRAAESGTVSPAVVSGEVGTGVDRRPVWVFSGQGSQWAGMGRDLLAHEPAFAEAIAGLDPLIAAETGWSVLEVLRSGAEVTGCGRVQPTLFAVQVALAATWRAHGVEPAGVIGHSMGEVAAAVVAGALSARDGAAVICRRSALLDRIAGAGSMAAVGLGRARVEADIADAGASALVSVAVLAGPESTVVAGDTEAVGALVALWDRRGVAARPVAVDVASHSPQVDPLLGDLAAALADLAPRTPSTRFFSTVETGRGEPAFDAAYWCANLRRPVRFAQAVAAAAAERALVFVEVSPHPVVAHALHDCLADADGTPVVLPTLRRDEDEVRTFRTQLAAAHCAGVRVDWRTRHGGGALADLPPITLDRVRHWVDVAPVSAAPALPGASAEVPGSPPRWQWRGDAGTAGVPWAADHTVHGDAVLPGAGFCALALTVACELFDVEPAAVAVSDVEFLELLRLDEHTLVSTVVTPTGEGGATCAFHSPGPDGWVLHATASVGRVGVPEQRHRPAVDPDALTAVDPEEFYTALRARGIGHGPVFAGVRELRVGDRRAWARIRVEPDAGALRVHPALLDVCAQVLVAALPGSDRLALPAGVGALRLLGDPAAAVTCLATVTCVDGDEVSGDVWALDADGAPVAAVAGLRVAVGAEPGVDEWFHAVDWVESAAGAPAPVGRWAVLGSDEVASALRGRGAEVRDWDGEWMPDGVVVCAGDDAKASVVEALAVAGVLGRADGDVARLYLAGDGSLAAGGFRGLVRVLAFEHPRVRATVVEAPDPGALVDELLSDSPDDEVRVVDGVRAVARLVRAPITTAERDTARACAVRHGVDRFRLRAGRAGDLGGMEVVAEEQREPGPGEVRIRVSAAGVNFRDVLTVMGLLPGDRIGFECAGVVDAVGGPSDLVVGQEVVAISLGGGLFGSFATVPARWVVPLPPGLDPVAAAGIPAVYATAWYALGHVARVRPGERVLVHSATGGTGLAAIAVARLLGATVVATAGTEEKREHLRRLGVDEVHDSRTLDFADALAGTVDVVLNSLSGAAITAGLRTLRPFGRFVELGVRDILADAPLGMAPLRHNITFAAVDLIELQENRPEVFEAVLREVMAEFAAGRLSAPLCRAFPFAEAEDAFRLMAGAGHTGKLVLTLPSAGSSAAVLGEPEPVVRAGGAYIVTGGLRGVGLETARWLARSGAGHIVLNGRSGAAVDGFGEARVTVVLGDIAEEGVAERLVAAAGPELSGVVHSAMVLADAAITTATVAQVEQVWRPKVTGAWRLHQALAGRSPDWLVLHSSMASLVGNPGQGVYAAANSWLDAFAQWRSALGLRTLAVNWGPWGETGVATGFAERGYRTIPTARGFEALQRLLAHGRVTTGVIPGPAETWIPATGRHSPVFQGVLGAAGPTADLVAELHALPPGPARRAALESFLDTHIRAVLRLGPTALDPQTPLRSLGFDSLLSIELRTRLETGLHITLPADFVWNHPTLARLASGLAVHMDLDLTVETASV